MLYEVFPADGCHFKDQYLVMGQFHKADNDLIIDASLHFFN